MPNLVASDMMTFTFTPTIEIHRTVCRTAQAHITTASHRQTGRQSAGPSRREPLLRYLPSCLTACLTSLGASAGSSVKSCDMVMGSPPDSTGGYSCVLLMGRNDSCTTTAAHDPDVRTTCPSPSCGGGAWQ